MKSKPLIDPELIELLQLYGSATESVSSVEGVRHAVAALTGRQPGQKRDDIVTHHVSFDGPHGAIQAPFYRSTDASAPSGVILHIHGGGYIAGSPEISAASAMDLAAALNCCVLGCRYSLAPEVTAPVALEECYAALAFLHANADEFGLDTSRIAVWGESAGGGLAAALSLLARDRGEFQVCFQMLVYPMLDDRTCVRTDLPDHVGEVLWTRELNRLGWTSYLGCEPGAPNVTASMAPARAEDFRGLPPTFVATAALDLFLEENLTYAAELLRAGVPTELHVAPGAFHGFEAAADTSVVRAAMALRFNALRRAFAI